MTIELSTMPTMPIRLLLLKHIDNIPRVSPEMQTTRTIIYEIRIISNSRICNIDCNSLKMKGFTITRQAIKPKVNEAIAIYLSFSQKYLTG